MWKHGLRSIEAIERRWKATAEMRRIRREFRNWCACRRVPMDECYPAGDDAGNETLIALVGRLRALAVQNDPDAVRDGPMEIAATLERWRPTA